MIEEELAKPGQKEKTIQQLERAKRDIQAKLGNVIESCEDAEAILAPEYQRMEDQALWQLIYNVYASQRENVLKDPIL